MNVVLIGYRGTGKSTVGKLLAHRLQRPLISTDAEIVRRAGRPVPQIVKEFGWEHFRDLETQVCKEVGERDGLIIDTGGGAILRPQNVAALKARGTVFWLTAAVSTIQTRIGDDSQRPSLTDGKSFLDEIEEVLKEREPLYRAAADCTIRTDGRPTDEVAQAILTRLQGL